MAFNNMSQQCQAGSRLSNLFVIFKSREIQSLSMNLVDLVSLTGFHSRSKHGLQMGKCGKRKKSLEWVPRYSW